MWLIKPLSLTPRRCLAFLMSLLPQTKTKSAPQESAWKARASHANFTTGVLFIQWWVMHLCRACCFNNKTTNTQRATGGPSVVLEQAECSHLLLRTLSIALWTLMLNECIDVNDATELWAARWEHALMFMDEVLGTNTKSRTGGAVKEWTASFFLVLIMSLSSPLMSPDILCSFEIKMPK